MDGYEAAYAEEFTRELERLDNSDKAVIAKKIRKILAQPELGKPLHASEGQRSERIMHLRIIYRIEGRRVEFLRIGKRDKIYRQLFSLLPPLFH